MKKLIITMLTAVGIMLGGCTPDENTLVSAAQTAGTIGMLTWFSIDNPDPQVKATLFAQLGRYFVACLCQGSFPFVLVRCVYLLFPNASKSKRWMAFPPPIVYCTICSANAFYFSATNLPPRHFMLRI